MDMMRFVAIFSMNMNFRNGINNIAVVVPSALTEQACRMNHGSMDWASQNHVSLPLAVSR